MCFSASASFTAGVILAGVGVLTIRSTKERHEIPYAAIPLLFAIQQISEGVVWLTFGADKPTTNMVSTQLFSFFSHVFWPWYVPLAILLIEPSARRRRLLSIVSLTGVLVGFYLLYYMYVFPITSKPSNNHIEYVSPHFYIAATITLYLISTTISIILSSHRTVQIFGLFVLLSFVAAYSIYAHWFISVWCFFAALLSVMVLLHFKQSSKYLI